MLGSEFRFLSSFVSISVVLEAVFVSRVADWISGSLDGNGSAVAVEAVCGSGG